MLGVDLRGQTFLDIGFGQGLTLLIATAMGARTAGCDINPLCVEVLQMNQRRFFAEVPIAEIPVVIGSILDDQTVERLRATAPDQTGAFDIVHSWGVLHHAGDMNRAIRLAASLVKRGGFLVIAIYARHWSSRFWLAIKRLYNVGPRWIQRALVALFSPVILAAKWIVTRRNPLKQTRGMNFY